MSKTPPSKPIAPDCHMYRDGWLRTVPAGQCHFNIISGVAERLVKSPWIGRPCCVACGNVLKRIDVLYNQGVCPHCGHVSGGTVCHTVIKVHRVIRRQRRFLFFWWRTVETTIETPDPDAEFAFEFRD